MSFLQLVRMASAILVTLGILLSPLAATAASARHSAGMADMAASGDMPCCPDEEKIKDCKDCPLVALCAFKTAQARPTFSEGLPLRYAVRTMHVVRDDAVSDGQVRPPPDHPPRTLS